jgi:hypothetical protein
MQILMNLLPIAVFAAVIYGLTRDRVTQPLGRWLAGGAFAVLLITVISDPDDGCYVDWDGRSNPTVCD